MSTGVILLLCYISPTIYADADTEYKRKYYVPRTPRKPMVLVWPSVMNPAVARAPAQDKENEYLKIECDRKSRDLIMQFNLIEVQCTIGWMDEIHKGLKFWDKMVPRLIDWLSAEVIECGIYTMFRKMSKEIYRFIKENRANWINALQELVYILLQVIAVIHSKPHTTTTDFIDMNKYKHLDWVENWERSYEEWFTNERKPVLKFEEYFQDFVLNSFDIVVAWLVDYMGQRAGANSNVQPVQPDFCGVANRPANCTFDFRPKFNVQTKWKLSGDRDIGCALRKSHMLQALERTFPFNWLLEALDPPERIKAMAHAFVTCKVQSGCRRNHENNYEINIGYKYDKKDTNKNYDEEYDEDDFFQKNKGHKYQVVRLPDRVNCALNCSALPKEFKHNTYSLAQVTAEHLEYYAYAHAHMTTEVAYDLICYIGGKPFGANKIDTSCQPQIAAQYLLEREYKCCNSHKNCEEYLEDENKRRGKLENIEKVTLSVKMKTFPGL